MLTDTDYLRAAEALGCEVANIRAVVSVESNGDGRLLDGRPKILFEAHKFSRHTGGKYDWTHPSLSSPTWNRALYRGGDREWERLNEAIALDSEAALKSASWGAFQILGENHRLCGYSSVTAFVDAIRMGGPATELDCFCRFVEASHLDDELRRGRGDPASWRPFARGYNGPGYAEHGYHIRLATAWRRAAGEPAALRMGDSGWEVRRLQTILNERAVAGGEPLKVDGDFGPATRDAVQFYQELVGLRPDGIVGPATWAKLTPQQAAA